MSDFSTQDLIDHFRQMLGIKPKPPAPYDGTQSPNPELRAAYLRMGETGNWEGQPPQIHSASEVRAIPNWQELMGGHNVYLPPVQMQPEPAKPSPAPASNPFEGEDIISMLAEAENRHAVPDAGQNSGAGDGSGSMRYSGPHLGQNRTAQEAMDYIKFLGEGQDYVNDSAVGPLARR